MRRYLQAEGWVAYSRPRRDGALSGLDGWLEERFFRHRGNAEVVRQDLKRELSIDASLRTVERAVAPHRRLLAARAKATVRFETAPGRQLQIDFGEARVPIGGEPTRVHLFVRRWGTRGGPAPRRSRTSGRRRGSPGSRGRSCASAG